MRKRLLRSLKYWIREKPFLYRIVAPIYYGVFSLGGGKKWADLARQDVIRLELGSGPKKGKDGWTTVDLTGADINWDLTKGVPLPNSMVDKIYSSHLLEHMSFQELIAFLKECMRVLKRGGEFSVCVPDAGRVIRAYYEGKDLTKPDMPKWAKVETGSRLDAVNYIAYMGGEHKYMFDNENLLKTLELVGFEAVAHREFDPVLDEKSRQIGSIYASAFK